MIASMVEDPFQAACAATKTATSSLEGAAVRLVDFSLALELMTYAAT